MVTQWAKLRRREWGADRCRSVVRRYVWCYSRVPALVGGARGEGEQVLGHGLCEMQTWCGWNQGPTDADRCVCDSNGGEAG